MGSEVDKARDAAVEVLRHNSRGPFCGLPRAAGWGYPEPYTRDLMLSSLGVLVSKDPKLVRALRRTLLTAARNQTPHGHIPSLVHDPLDCGASDTTPLFIIAAEAYRRATRTRGFLVGAIGRARAWMQHQSPTDGGLVAQLPTSDWRDEQWVEGYGIYVNVLAYMCFRLSGDHAGAARIKKLVNKPVVTADSLRRHEREGLFVRSAPCYALWSYKIHNCCRFDLLGNSLAILSGVASRTRAGRIIAWIESQCEAMRSKGVLAVDLPPVLFPYIKPGDPDWRPRYDRYNRPGCYHNGGIWPVACGLYVAACVAAGKYRLAQRKLRALTELVRRTRTAGLEFGFNEWLRAQDGTPMGQDWQTWSAAMYIYAAACVEQRRTPVFDEARTHQFRPSRRTAAESEGGSRFTRKR